jgi:protein phosphatase
LVRGSNEDSFFADDELGLYVVADGMGGHLAGEVASRMAVECAVAAVRGGLAVAGDPTTEQLGRLVRAAVLSGASAIHRRSNEEASLRGMGTTITLVLLRGQDAVLGHVGDSRLYLARGGRILQQTSDHTAVAALVEEGLLTKAEARAGPFGHVLSRSLGSAPDVEVDVALLDLRDGDRLLLCTDGLTDHIDEADSLLDDLEATLDRIPNTLVDFANESGGHDNVTVLVVEVLSDEGPSSSSWRLEPRK